MLRQMLYLSANNPMLQTARALLGSFGRSVATPCPRVDEESEVDLEVEKLDADCHGNALLASRRLQGSFLCWKRCRQASARDGCDGRCWWASRLWTQGAGLELASMADCDG